MRIGFNVGTAVKTAKINFNFIFKQNGKKIATYFMKKVTGSAHYELGMRLSESYGKAGKKMAKYINKDLD